MKSLRILLVDDHTIVREGLKLLISAQPDMKVVGEAGNGKEALEAFLLLSPDIVVMDISMPEMDGFKAAQALRQAHPGVKILILTTHDDQGLFVKVCQAGASGYVLKRVASSELLNGIRKVAAGQLHFDEALAGRALVELTKGSPALSKPGDGAPSRSLSDREEEVLRGVALGYTNKELAQQLSLSVKTIETHKVRICNKLDLSSRADMVRYALAQGWMENSSSAPAEEDSRR